MTSEQLQNSIKSFENPERAMHSQRFFKTAKGQYGEGDVFLGLSNPQQWAIAKKFTAIPVPELQILLDSLYHEFRMTALMILVEKMKKAKGIFVEEIVAFYLKNVYRINNWDLVDCSCRDVLGKYLLDKDRQILYELAASGHLWSERIAMVSTWAFIRQNQVSDTIRLAEILLNHPHDLIHKAVGWMLREAHKRQPEAIEEFLEAYTTQMPRTMLRYAIERFEAKQKRYFMEKKADD